MHDLRRVLALATAAILALALGACDLAVASPSPGLNATPPIPTSTPIPTTTAQPTLAVTAEPVPTCPATPSPAELIFQTGPGTELIALDGEPLASPESVDATSVPIVATVLGGVRHIATVSPDEGPVNGLAIIGATADFLPFGTASTLPVKVTIDTGTAAIVLPDSSLAGQLRITISWAGPCGTGDGSGSVALAVVRSAVAAGCPKTSAGLLTEAAKFDGLHASAGTLQIPLILTGWSGRWIPGVGASDIPQFAGWDRDHGVTAAPEGLVVISETVTDLALQGIQVSIYLRADVLRFLEPDSTGELDTLAFIHRNANTRGRASIPAPLEPGRYVVEVVGTWLTPCLTLDTYSPFSLEVR